MNLAAAAAEGAAPNPLLLILPAEAELVYGALAFLIVYIVLQKAAFPKLGQALDERRAAIVGKMEEADAAKAEMERAKAAFDAKMADAQGEAARIIDEAKSTAESIRRDIVAKAEAEAKAVRQRAEADVAGERDRLVGDLRVQLADLSVELAGRIVEKELDASSHQHLVDEYIGKLANAN